MLAVHLELCSCSLGVLQQGPASSPGLGPPSGDTSWGWEVSRAGHAAFLVMDLVLCPRDTAEVCQCLDYCTLGDEQMASSAPPAVHPEAPSVEGCMFWEEVSTGWWVLSDQECPSADGSSDILEQLPQLEMVSCRPTGLLCSLFSFPWCLGSRGYCPSRVQLISMRSGFVAPEESSKS